MTKLLRITSVIASVLAFIFLAAAVSRNPFPGSSDRNFTDLSLMMGGLFGALFTLVTLFPDDNGSKTAFGIFSAISYVVAIVAFLLVCSRGPIVIDGMIAIIIVFGMIAAVTRITVELPVIARGLHRLLLPLRCLTA